MASFNIVYFYCIRGGNLIGYFQIFSNVADNEKKISFGMRLKSYKQVYSQKDGFEIPIEVYNAKDRVHKQQIFGNHISIKEDNSISGTTVFMVVRKVFLRVFFSLSF